MSMKFIAAIITIIVTPLEWLAWITTPFRSERRRVYMPQQQDPQLSQEEKNDVIKGWLFKALIVLAVCAALAFFVDAWIGGISLIVFAVRALSGGGAA
jgi:hypothetical protein